MELSKQEICPAAFTFTMNLVLALLWLIKKSAGRVVAKFAMFAQLSVGSRHTVRKETD
ncbi:hypothetical protein KIN20_008762 [Parelaphostrongylus tenuis]|uniref:Uncharacterized protein n=1 Tax=Parelaphostrongylus tenuis TaxID=148309 RepID=A0AAD5MPI4_PARTN|nr:hypothetical protein KIN20_008762 [Parelaphostrongylus tenuis]